MKFSIELKQVKVREFLACDGDLQKMLQLMARFMIDENSEAIPQEQAIELLYDLDLEESQKAQADFLTVLQSAMMKGRR